MQGGTVFETVFSVVKGDLINEAGQKARGIGAVYSPESLRVKTPAIHELARVTRLAVGADRTAADVNQMLALHGIKRLGAGVLLGLSQKSNNDQEISAQPDSEQSPLSPLFAKMERHLAVEGTLQVMIAQDRIRKGQIEEANRAAIMAANLAEKALAVPLLQQSVEGMIASRGYTLPADILDRAAAAHRQTLPRQTLTESVSAVQTVGVKKELGESDGSILGPSLTGNLLALGESSVELTQREIQVLMAFNGAADKYRSIHAVGREVFSDAPSRISGVLRSLRSKMNGLTGFDVFDARKNRGTRLNNVRVFVSGGSDA